MYQHQHVLSPSSGSGRQGNGLKPIHVQNKQPLQQLQPQLQPHQQQQYQAQQAPQLPLSTNHGRIGHGGDQNQNHAARNVATSQPAYGGPPKAAADNLSYSSKPSTVTYNSTEQGQGSMIPGWTIYLFIVLNISHSDDFLLLFHPQSMTHRQGKLALLVSYRYVAYPNLDLR